jgi:hypothetical protein
MAWQFIKTITLTDQWQSTDWLSGNLFKLEHNCSLPSTYSWNYTGLVGQILLDSDFNKELYGEVQRLYFFPSNQYILFDSLDNIESRKLAIKGYWSKQTTFNWEVKVYMWNTLINENNNVTNIDLSPLLSQIATLNTKLDQIIININKPGNSKK